MTDAKRREAILSLLREQTMANTATKAKARKTLIDEGIYTKGGALKEEFGGRRRKAANAA